MDKVTSEKIEFISESLGWTEKQTKVLTNELANLLLTSYIGEFALEEDGTLKFTEGNSVKVSQINKIFDEWVDSFVTAFLFSYILRLEELNKLTRKYYKGIGVSQKELAKVNTDIVLRGLGFKDGVIKKDSFLWKVAKMDEVRMQLINYTQQSLAEGRTFSKFRSGFVKLLRGSEEKLGAVDSFIKQNLYDLFNQYERMVNLQFARDLGLKWFTYEGSLIDTSREFCIKRDGKLFKIEQASRWKFDKTLPGQNDLANYNPLIELGRFFCRHHLEYHTDAYAKENMDKRYTLKN